MRITFAAVAFLALSAPAFSQAADVHGGMNDYLTGQRQQMQDDQQRQYQQLQQEMEFQRTQAQSEIEGRQTEEDNRRFNESMERWNKSQ
jgi:hypothetical protein